MLRKICVPKTVDITWDWRKLHSEELHDFLLFTKHFTGDENEWDGRGMWLVWGKRDKLTGCWWGNQRERVYLVDLRLDGMIMVKVKVLP